MRNAVSRKQKGFEQSNLDPRFETSERTLTALRNRAKNFKCYSFFFCIKIHKNAISYKHTNLGSQIWMPCLQPLSVP